MNFIRNRNFRAGPQTSLEGFICPQNSDKQQKIKVFGRSGGDANSLKYCFEGLPEKSIIAVCGIGHSFCQSADILWHHAVKQLIAQKQPTRLIVYGGKYPDNLSSLLPVTYIPDHITKNFRSNENTNSCIIEGRQEAV